jgi:hypothetical protein
LTLIARFALAFKRNDTRQTVASRPSISSVDTYQKNRNSGTVKRDGLSPCGSEGGKTYANVKRWLAILFHSYTLTVNLQYPAVFMN